MADVIDVIPESHNMDIVAGILELPTQLKSDIGVYVPQSPQAKTNIEYHLEIMSEAKLVNIIDTIPSMKIWRVTGRGHMHLQQLKRKFPHVYGKGSST